MPLLLCRLFIFGKWNKFQTYMTLVNQSTTTKGGVYGRFDCGDSRGRNARGRSLGRPLVLSAGAHIQ